MQANNGNHQPIKIVVVGSPATGKTAFVRYHARKAFVARGMVTREVEHHSFVKETSNGTIHYELTDIPAQKSRERMYDHYLGGAHAVVFMFSLHQICTYKPFRDLCDRIRNTYKYTTIPIALCGSRYDLCTQGQEARARSVDVEKEQQKFGQLAPKKKGFGPIEYFPTSALTGENMNSTIEWLTRHIMNDEHLQLVVNADLVKPVIFPNIQAFIEHEAAVERLEPNATVAEDSTMVTLKIAISGDAGVGKTAWTKKVTENIDVEVHHVTHGHEEHELHVTITAGLRAGNRAKFILRDINGMLKREDISKGHYQGMDGSIVMMSVDRHSTNTTVPDWINFAQRHVKYQNAVIVCGNMVDCPREVWVSSIKAPVRKKKTGKKKNALASPYLEMSVKQGKTYNIEPLREKCKKNRVKVKKYKLEDASQFDLYEPLRLLGRVILDDPDFDFEVISY